MYYFAKLIPNEKNTELLLCLFSLRPSVYVPRLHHHRQPLLGHRERQEDREGSYNSRPPHDSCVDKPQADSENKDDSLQRPCHQHTAVRQRDMDYVCQTGEKTQHLPLEKFLPFPGHILERQCPTPRSCLVLAFLVCMYCSASADCAD